MEKSFPLVNQKITLEWNLEDGWDDEEEDPIPLVLRKLSDEDLEVISQ